MSEASITKKATFGLDVPPRLTPDEAEAAPVSLKGREAIEIQETIERRKAITKTSVAHRGTADDRIEVSLLRAAAIVTEAVVPRAVAIDQDLAVPKILIATSRLQASERSLENVTQIKRAKGVTDVRGIAIETEIETEIETGRGKGIEIATGRVIVVAATVIEGTEGIGNVKELRGMSGVAIRTLTAMCPAVVAGAEMMAKEIRTVTKIRIGGEETHGVAAGVGVDIAGVVLPQGTD